jgi:ABC-2 type transport system ATP-binding protein
MTLDIAVENLTLRYDDVTALDELTFSLEGGKIYGLLGRNGSGKTSLLSVLAAFRKATAGQARVGGQPVFENPMITRQICLIREGGDMVEQDWPDNRIKDMLALAAYVRPGWDADYAAALLERFELSPDTRIPALSRGKRSALAVLLGLATRAPVTMFDESYLGMDAPSRYAFYDELLTDFMDHPRTIIISTHLIEEVSSLFEEVVIIDRGRLVLHEEADRLRSRGAAVTGAADVVDRFADGLTVLGKKTLGPTKSVMVYGALDDAYRERARTAGLDIGPIALQDLFVHLTEPKETADERP